VQLDEGIALLDLGRAHHGEIDALIARHADHVMELLHAVLGVREPDRAGDVIVHGVADLVAEAGIELS
jgi:hypothetical protein